MLGGASLSGGIGRISGTFFGAIVIGIISNGLVLINVSSFWQLVVKGIIILIAVIIDSLKGSRSPSAACSQGHDDGCYAQRPSRETRQKADLDGGKDASIPEAGTCRCDRRTDPFFHDGKYHIFSLTPPPGTGTYPERLRTTWHHTWSDNLVEWQDVGPALLPGGPDEPDADGCWTGSVVFGEGMFHAFYTGYSIHATFPQTICHAASLDGVRWTKDPSNPCILPKTDQYESLDWRDPYAFYNDEDKCYLMILSARRNSGPVARRGCVVLYRSRDLAVWEHHGPIYDPKHTNCPECPELYRIGDTWYLSYSRFSEFGGTIYRMSDNPLGGWRTPLRDRIGSRRFYAAKSMADDKGGRYYFGWDFGQGW